MTNTEESKLDKLFSQMTPEAFQKLPVSMHNLHDHTGGIILVDISSVHHTTQLPCFIFYKPISQMYKSFEK